MARSGTYGGDKYFPKVEVIDTTTFREDLAERDRTIVDLTREVQLRDDQLAHDVSFNVLLKEKNFLQQRLKAAETVLLDLRNVLECREDESAPEAACRLITEVQARTAAGYEGKLAFANTRIEELEEQLASMQPLQISGTLEQTSVFIEATPEYAELCRVLAMAVDQAANGKGKERHAKDGEPFEKQKICEITRRVGIAFPLGQAIKKAEESLRLDLAAGIRENLGAINYLAASVIVMEEIASAQE